VSLAAARHMSIPNPITKRAELAAFLRGRRARLTPAQVGLPNGARRRTPGLRREEVALLADVGASWYTWLEQGRDIHVSEGVLERLSRALRLDPAERLLLFELAQGRSPRHAVVPAETVGDVLRRTLDAHRDPAIVSTLRWDVVAMNAPALKLWGDRRGTNSLWTMFTDAVSPFSSPEREAHARQLVARFRLEAARASDREPFDQLVSELLELSDDFRIMWDRHDVLAAPEGAKIIHHPAVGAIELEHVALMHVEPDGRTLRVTLYTPPAGDSAERLAKVLASPDAEPLVD
jgi:transcriptional regulator with XRE-family HTH domain